MNGHSIEQSRIDNAVKRIEARAGGPVPPERRDEVLRGVLDELVAYHLLAQESRARRDRRQWFRTSTRGWRRSARAFRVGESLSSRASPHQGLTPEHLREQTRTSLEVAKVIEAEVTPHVAVQDAEVNTFYQQNLERFKQGENVRASHILFGVAQEATAVQKTEAKAKAQSALKEVRAGADFAAVARAQSQDQGSAQQGGELGFFPKGQMNPHLEDAAFKLKAGTVSPVVETPFGFHIIKVHERRGPRTAPLGEVAAQIKEFLAQGQREQKLEQFVGQSRAKGRIEILL